MPVIVEMWADVVCPWCYLGRARLREAVDGFEHADQVTIVHRAFELNPGALPGQGDLMLDVLQERYGFGEAEAQAAEDRVGGLAAEVGLPFAGGRHTGNSLDAHRLLHLALDRGGAATQHALTEALMSAHFVDVHDVSDHAVLRETAIGVGLEAAEVDEVLAGDRYREAVSADIEQARAYGAGGVPFFVFEGAYAVSGAQPVEVFADVLDQVWQATRPAPLPVVAGGEVCGPGGCD